MKVHSEAEPTLGFCHVNHQARNDLRTYDPAPLPSPQESWHELWSSRNCTYISFLLSFRQAQFSPCRCPQPAISNPVLLLSGRAWELAQSLPALPGSFLAQNLVPLEVSNVSCMIGIGRIQGGRQSWGVQGVGVREGGWTVLFWPPEPMFYYVYVTLVGKVTHSKGSLSAKKGDGNLELGTASQWKGSWASTGDGRKGEIERRGFRVK